MEITKIQKSNFLINFFVEQFRLSAEYKISFDCGKTKT
jgi:hypothetical protein